MSDKATNELDNEELLEQIRNLPPEHADRKTAELLLQYSVSKEMMRQGRKMSFLTVVMILFMFLQIIVAIVSIYSPPVTVKLQKDPVVTRIDDFQVICTNERNVQFICKVISTK